MDASLLIKAQNAKNASKQLVKFTSEQKNHTLLCIAEILDSSRVLIKEQNRLDLENAHKKGMTDALIDRLTLNDKRIDGMIQVLHDVISLKDPVGQVIGMNTMPNGLKIGQMRMPLGVAGIIFESRPNVCIEVAALTIKSANGVILKGGSDAIHSNHCITGLIKQGLKKAGLPEGAVEIIESTDRESVKELLKLKQYIDVIIPRGGLNLIRFVEENSVIPVIRHDEGICHTYIDEFAQSEMAVSIAYNAKVQRPGVCNAMETLLVHEKIAPIVLPLLKTQYDKAGVKLKGCDKTRTLLPDIEKATEQDWTTEYLDLILSIRIVKNLDEAINHINTYGSHHSDAIVTENYSHGMQFLHEVDSAACYINASTRFTDGNEFGLGAEMGISNQKLHVRGPMGLTELTSPKYIVFGNGQIRQ
ncbi:MAG: glutamate-5-semialdehyde dehydrogenase [Bacteroidota bacterium]|nr:MAG: glutamate-5-semialdehyde dehydrogenase [Bacteroidota bacterium]